MLSNLDEIDGTLPIIRALDNALAGDERCMGLAWVVDTHLYQWRYEQRRAARRLTRQIDRIASALDCIGRAARRSEAA